MSLSSDESDKEGHDVYECAYGNHQQVDPQSFSLPLERITDKSSFNAVEDESPCENTGRKPPREVVREE